MECVYPVLPMISDVICLPFYDRIFCLLSCFFTFAVFQVDCRAFYNRLYGIASDCENDTLLVLGIIATFTLPAIGFFDEHTWGTIHGLCATLFFGSVGIYAFLISGIMESNMDKFPRGDWPKIKLMKKVSKLMMLVLLTFALSISFKGSNFWLTPLTEWLATILFVNYFAIISWTNTYYDSVHSFDSEVAKTQGTVSQEGYPVVYQAHQ